MRLKVRTLLAVSLAAGLASAALAQVTTDPPPPPPVPPDGGTGGGSAVYYLSVVGAVEKVNDGGITVRTDPPGSAAVEVLVTKETRYTRLEYVDLDQIGVGDSLSVSGKPKGIVADSAQAGDWVYVPSPGSDGEPAPPGPTDPSGGRGVYVSASAHATGVVQSVDKTSRIVVLTLNDGSHLAVDFPAEVKVHRTRAVTLAEVKVGDRILANGFVPWPERTGGGEDGRPPDGAEPDRKPQPEPYPVLPEGPFTATDIQLGEVGYYYYPTPVPPPTPPPPPPPAPDGPVPGDGGDVPVTPPVIAPGVPPGPGEAGGVGDVAGPSVSIRGNLTGSGKLSVADALLALRIAAGLVEPTPAQIAAGSLTTEGKVTVQDALRILRAVAFGEPL